MSVTKQNKKKELKLVLLPCSSKEEVTREKIVAELTKLIMLLQNS